MIENLLRFSEGIKFQKTIVSILVGLHSDNEEMQELQIAFKQMDKDKNGVISMKEFKQANIKDSLKDNWEFVFNQMDLDGDGQVDYQEFFTAFVNHRKLITRTKLEQLFKILDKNLDGNIDI